MRKMAKMSIWERIKMVTGMGKAGAFSAGRHAWQKPKATPAIARSPKERAKERKKKKRKIDP